MKNVLLIDKPDGWTSFDVVAKVRSQIRQNFLAKGEKPTKKQLRVGHAGTLDPFATGLLIVLLGEACKDADTFLKLDKRYEFTAKLGEVSSTGDPEGDIVPYVPDGDRQKPGHTVPATTEILRALRSFTGEVQQTPPVYSAIKVNGQRAYKLARDGKTVDMPTRTVRIDQLELISYEYPYLKAVCTVSSGTYIRSLVEDLGRMLNTGAYCSELRRLQIGEYLVKNSETVERTVAQLKAEQKEQ